MTSGARGMAARLDARAKIAAVVAALLVCVSTPAGQFGAFAAYFAVLAAVCVAARVPLGVPARRMLAVLPMVLLCAAFAPFLPDGGGHGPGMAGPHVSRTGLLVLWNVTAKALLGVGLVTLLTETTPFPLLLRGLERLRCPRVFLQLLAFCQRFVFVLRDEALRMKRAATARNFRGRWLWHAPVVGRMIGALFLRGYERGERVCLAMAARGFTGTMPAAETTPMGRADGALLAATLAAFLAIRILVP